MVTGDKQSKRCSHIPDRHEYYGFNIYNKFFASILFLLFLHTY
jgi:hypothetical protein